MHWWVLEHYSLVPLPSVFFLVCYNGWDCKKRGTWWKFLDKSKYELIKKKNAGFALNKVWEQF